MFFFLLLKPVWLNSPRSIANSELTVTQPAFPRVSYFGFMSPKEHVGTDAEHLNQRSSCCSGKCSSPCSPPGLGPSPLMNAFPEGIYFTLTVKCYYMNVIFFSFITVYETNSNPNPFYGSCYCSRLSPVNTPVDLLILNTFVFWRSDGVMSHRAGQ